MSGRSFFTFFALLILPLTSTLEAARHEKADPRTVLILGDSLSAGYRLRSDQAWPALIEPRLRAIDPRFRVVNASVSGSTTVGGLRRLPTHLRYPIEIFVLELGINDAFQNASVTTIQRHLNEIIALVKAKNPQASIVIVGMQFPLAASDDYVTAFGQMFGEVAKENKATLVPYLLAGVAGNPSLNLSDYIHPNAAGHRILAETMWRVLEPLGHR